MKAIKVACTHDGCTTFAVVAPTSPAAPMLTALEQLAPIGWSYQVGFFQMLTGDHQQLCPRHTKGRTR